MILVVKKYKFMVIFVQMLNPTRVAKLLMTTVNYSNVGPKHYWSALCYIRKWRVMCE